MQMRRYLWNMIVRFVLKGVMRIRGVGGVSGLVKVAFRGYDRRRRVCGI